MQIYNGTLTKDSVSIQSDEFGMRAYINSVQGRTLLESECSADIVQTIEAAWGDTVTVTEPVMPVVNAVPTSEEQLRADVGMVNSAFTDFLLNIVPSLQS